MTIKEYLITFIFFILIFICGYFFNASTIDDYQYIQETLNKFAEHHNYSNEYNCKNYSNDLNFILNNLGYDSKITIGTDDKIKGHAWNSITFEIEPQTGQIINKKFNFTKKWN